MVELPHEPHSAIICGQTGCGKTQFVLDELLHPDKGIYRDAFENVFVLCPTWRRNKTYLERPWLWRNKCIYFIDPRDRLTIGCAFCLIYVQTRLHCIYSTTWRHREH